MRSCLRACTGLTGTSSIPGGLETGTGAILFEAGSSPCIEGLQLRLRADPCRLYAWLLAIFDNSSLLRSSGCFSTLQTLPTLLFAAVHGSLFTSITGFCCLYCGPVTFELECLIAFRESASGSGYSPVASYPGLPSQLFLQPWKKAWVRPGSKHHVTLAIAFVTTRVHGITGSFVLVTFFTWRTPGL